MYFHMVSPRSLPVSFVGNLEVLCDKIPDLLASSSALKFFCSLLDLDLSCFYAWSSSSSRRRELNNGFLISLGQRDLEGQVTYCKQLHSKVLVGRIEELFTVAKQYNWAIITFKS